MIDVIALGRLITDIHLEKTSNGTAFVSFAIASKSNIKTDDGYKTDFIDCIIWRQKAENLNRFHLKRGALIKLTGYLDSEVYESEDRKKKNWKIVVSEFELCGRKDDETESTPNEEPKQVAIPDDDLPFNSSMVGELKTRPTTKNNLPMGCSNSSFI